MPDPQRGAATPLFEVLLAQFQTAGAELRAAGLVSSHGGNLSVWTPDGVVITRENAMLGRLSAADLCLVSRTTRQVGGNPALDTPIHRAAYVMSDGRALLHAHPPYAVALSLTAQVIAPIDVEGRHLLHQVPVLAHARDIVRQVGEALESLSVVLVRGHGCFARGADLLGALQIATQLEESAKLLVLARQIALPATEGEA